MSQVAPEDDDPKDEDDESEEEDSEEEDETSEEESEEEDEDVSALTENQRRLLYIIGSYTKPTLADEEKSEWIRRNALVVLIYEAIVGGNPDKRTPAVLEYDYAPASVLIEGRRIWCNLPHEGLSDLDYLCEEGLVQLLKMASNLHTSITAYQVTDKGMHIVDRLSKVDKGPVNELIFAPGTSNKLSVNWYMDETITDGSGGQFIIRDEKGDYEYPSTITDVEDVSYVSSAYIPLCLRQGGRPTLSNAHRAHESAAGEMQIKDVLDEVITLNSVSVIVSEFIPYGANSMVTTNMNLGSQERVQGGLFTPGIETDKVAIKLYVKPGLTKVDILDFSLSSHVNFEAEIHAVEESGIVQVEQFGISLNANGSCYYGMQIEAVQDRIRDGISLDQLSRVLVDVQTDSSTVVDTIITHHQNDLERLIFRDDEENRSKVKLVVANEIVPQLLAEEYMDRGEYENELRQVIGDTKTAYDISEHDVLIFGDEGLMLVGPNSRHHEPLLCSYLEVVNLDLYTRFFYQRLFFEIDQLRTLKLKVFNADSDPDTVPRTRRTMALCSVHLTMLEEVLGYINESLDHVMVPPEPPESTGRALFARLEIPTVKRELEVRVRDLKKIMKGSWDEFNILREVTTNANDDKWYRQNEMIQENTKMLCLLQENNRRSMQSLNAMQVSLGGLLAFAVLDRITGSWSLMVDVQWFEGFAQLIETIPTLWFFVSLSFWVLTAGGLILFLRRLAHLSKGTIALSIKVHQKIDTEHLAEYLATKNLEDETHKLIDGNHVVKVIWTEARADNWGGFKPKFEVEFDDATGFMLNININYNRRQAKKYLAFNSEELKQQLFEEMHAKKVFIDTYYMPKSSDVVKEATKND